MTFYDYVWYPHSKTALLYVSLRFTVRNEDHPGIHWDIFSDPDYPNDTPSGLLYQVPANLVVAHGTQIEPVLIVVGDIEEALYYAGSYELLQPDQATILAVVEHNPTNSTVGMNDAPSHRNPSSQS